MLRIILTLGRAMAPTQGIGFNATYDSAPSEQALRAPVFSVW